MKRPYQTQMKSLSNIGMLFRGKSLESMAEIPTKQTNKIIFHEYLFQSVAGVVQGEPNAEFV